MRIDVTVTAEDIAKGVPDMCFLCPVARALQRETGNSLANVGDTWFSTNGHDIGPLPLEVRKRINIYDRLGTMEPFSFDLEVYA